ncbi:helix-turn-helix transcriptional regulator [Falsirhodobacter xinxiangensis]|uniref:helix-turn-helix transcriptional regulator n=1 Tax=Falsirhodobacter xinxiangensis TaxID=2530049 RepID=UPI0010AB26A2|nr:WYL domain-containing protein [Rhodobacter xinxiangensis]
MSFAKAHDLLRLALMAQARYDGVSLQDIAQEFAVSHRTAQRMTEALESLFEVEKRDDEDRRRRWKIGRERPIRLPRRQDTALEALDLAVRTARADHRTRHAEALAELRDALVANMAPRDALRAEADAEAILQTLGHVARPGPRITVDPDLLEAISSAIRSGNRLQVMYHLDDAPRILDPHGILLGERAYLVARQPAKGPMIVKFRLDRIHQAQSMDEPAQIEDGFSIEAFAARGFGVWHNPAQHDQVVWRFAPEAADHAAGFRFHPHQTLEPQPDGSLVVRFEASGWLEMAWFLYKWGDSVEVLAPQGLRDLVQDHRRGDFDGMP